jgi:SAM-dependent methyltransferase
MNDSVQQFYDDLAAHYTDIFADWSTSVPRQAEILDRLIQAQGDTPPLRLLDCTCGVGTQAIGLALRGYMVQATDLSPASIEQARQYASQFGIHIDFGVADVRQLAAQVSGEFDVVISFDNALPHLIDDADLRLAARNIYAKVRPGGLFMASIRDYDQAVQDKPHVLMPRVHDTNGERRIVFQVWDWSADGRTYTVQHFIVRGSGSNWQTLHGATLYRALQRAELSTFLGEAGFIAIQWHTPEDSGYYQPIVTAKRGGT